MLKVNNVNLISSAFLLFYVTEIGSLGVSWDWGKWWSYDGISGPQFWGLINPEWSLCTHGRRQSPVNLEPSLLLYDPNLRPLHIDKHRVSGIVNNTGHSVVFTIDPDMAPSNVGEMASGSLGLGSSSLTQNRHGSNKLSNYRESALKNVPINITGGPLSYRYRIYGYNSQLFHNFSEAVSKAHGIVAISIMIQIGNHPTPELRLLTDAISHIRYAGNVAQVHQLSIQGLLGTTEHYMTYEGSLTQPPCHETVTWVVSNKPIYINKQQLHTLRKLHQGPASNPKAKMVNNYRPAQQLHHRALRTNIDFTNAKQLHCPSMARHMYYKANTWR